MNWRNPAEELPEQNQTVWVMLEPHKERGDLLESAMSIEIVAGITSYSNDNKSIRVENYDELGRGGISWYLKYDADDYYPDSIAIAWLPINEMEFPKWLK